MTDSSDLPPPAPIPLEFTSIAPLLLRTGPFAGPQFEPTPDVFQYLHDETRVLVVGAGGLGCEILKDLALSGFRDIHVIDMDTIDVSNLNRQFLFRAKDCGQFKAKVAAEFIERRCPGVRVQWHTRAIQEFDRAWYKQFDVVIAGLDNIEARQWLNAALVDLVQFDDQGGMRFETVIPLIDGGTEGFGGQARVFMPRVTSCFECSLASLPVQVGFPSCTIRNVPRLPDHCITYALKVEWPLLEAFTSPTDYRLYEKKSPSDEFQPSAVPLDKDNAEHMTWLYERALHRAQQFNITGVTYSLTMQVVKNVIPAIASTNALISAACVNEALKLRTGASLRLDNYFMYMGGQSTGINTETLRYARNPECAVCQAPKLLRVDGQSTLEAVLEVVKSQFALEKPSLSHGAQLLYLPNLHADYAANLTRRIEELVPQSRSILIANDRRARTVKILVAYTNRMEEGEGEGGEA